ncbi:MAG: hypothetical protein JNL28_12790 [Planctomycetes bacterium]|nr:hypothetical protein [Planctomycetota bacterium]
MSHTQRITWIGPVSDDASAGFVARQFVDGLTEEGVKVQVLDTGDGTHPVDFDVDGPVNAAGTLIVRQANLSQIARTSSLVPLSRTGVNAAYVVVDSLADAAGTAFLAECDEVWAPSFFQAEILASLGVPRSRLFVVAPGLGRDARGVPATAGTGPILVVGAVERAAIGAARVVESQARPGSRAFVRELDAAAGIIVAEDLDPWGATALLTARTSAPLAHVESGTALEFIEAAECHWFDADSLREPARLEEITARLAAEPAEVARARSARLIGSESNARAARALLERHAAQRTLPTERLALVLADLGLPTPADRLHGSRPSVEILPVHSAAGAWIEILAERLARTSSNTTIVLWLDESAADESARIGDLAQTVIARSGRDEGEIDVLIVVAPLAHAPRDKWIKSGG